MSLKYYRREKLNYNEKSRGFIRIPSRLNTCLDKAREIKENNSI